MGDITEVFLDKQLENINKKEKSKPSLALAPEDSKEIQPITKQEDENLDQHGRPIWEDKIVFKLQHKDLIFMHQTIRLVMEKGLVPPEEVGPCMTLLEELAVQESEVHKKSGLILPINYFVGMWHALNTARMFSLYSQQFKKKDKHLENIVMRIAKRLDEYHTVKSHEANESKMDKSPQYFKELAEVKGLNLLEESKKPNTKKKKRAKK
jgi:hypothetical protein